MLSHSSRKGRLMYGRESIKVRIRAACSVRGTSGEDGEKEAAAAAVGADCSKVSASLVSANGNGLDVAVVSNR